MDRPQKVDRDGYVRVRVFPEEREEFSCYPNGWTLQHRLVMEQHLGRRLRKGETIYHRNGNRQDNRIENLELTPSRSRGRFGPKAGAWKGGRYVTRKGYVRLQVEGRGVLEHRHVMEQVLDRPLRANETVHHKNGKRDDNRPENLELWVGGHPPGQRDKHCPTCTCFDH